MIDVRLAIGASHGELCLSFRKGIRYGNDRRRSSGGFQSEINVTPMVDIMLVLLIIFMVVTPLLQHGITVALPQNTLNPDEDPRIIKESSVVISIPNNGEYYLGKIRVPQEDIKTKGRSDVGENQG